MLKPNYEQSFLFESIFFKTSAYNKSLECQLELIKLHCDREALDFFYIHSNSMSQQLITEHCSVFDKDNQKFCRYTPVKENEPNKNSKSVNGSSNLQQSVVLLTVLFGLALIVSSFKVI